MFKWWNLYFVQEAESGNIKIGIARNLKQRLYELQTDNSNKLNLLGSARFSSEQAVRKAEQRLHATFATQRVRGEWFATSARLAQIAISAC
jgi:predicted GIY-YIG superfamily endonuclease